MKKFEINKNLFKVGDNYVCVSDDEIKEGDGYYYSNMINTANTNYSINVAKHINAKKVIFSYPFIHESIPVLNIESEEVILAKNKYHNHLIDNDSGYEYSGFIEGYQKAKETFKYTYDDILKIIEQGMINSLSIEELWETRIRLIQQPKEIESIEVEYEDMYYYGIKKDLVSKDFIIQRYREEYYIEPSEYWLNSQKCLKPIILPNGRVKCKINYK